MIKKGRVAIVHPWSNFDTIPSLCNTALLLAQHGYSVDVFTNTNPAFNFPDFDGHDVNLNIIGTDAIFSSASFREESVDLLRTRLRKLGILFSALKIFYRMLRKPYDLAKQSIQHIVEQRRSLQIWRAHRQNPFTCFIGVDPQGLVQADMLSKFINVPLVYYSLELLLSYEISDVHLEALKKHEIKLSQKAAFVIIQDRDRAQLLAEDNKISLKKCVMVPNSPLGAAQHRRSSYWHKRFNLSQDTRIVLHAGSLSRWTGIDEIVESVKSWPEKWTLVVHARYDAESSEDAERLRELSDPKRVFFSLKPVSRQEYNELVNGADIGIAFYVPQDDSVYTQLNIQTIGLSSGKLAYYLQSGLPVIVNDVTSVSDFLQREKCGVGVKEGALVGKAIAKIAQDYDEYSCNACRVFNNFLDFEGSFQAVVRRIKGLK